LDTVPEFDKKRKGKNDKFPRQKDVVSGTGNIFFKGVEYFFVGVMKRGGGRRTSVESILTDSNLSKMVPT